MSASQEILAKMQKKSKTEIDPNNFYPRLMINRLTRIVLWFAIMLVMVPMTILVFLTHRHADLSWQLMSLPIIGTGLIVTLVPLSELWEYKPWQISARQFEKHYRYSRSSGVH